MTLDISNAISRGGKEAEQMVEDNKLPSGGFDKINWFALKDRERKIFRFLTDHTEWPNVLQHPYSPTRPPSPDWTTEQKKNWPAQMNPICRKTPQFVQFFPDGCYICDEMHTVRPNEKAKKAPYRYFPQVREWALAVEREEVIVETHEQAEQYEEPIGTVLGLRDVEVEVEEFVDGKATGRKIKKKKIVVFNMAIRNFFGPLQGYADVYHTVLDRDYSIRRKGTGNETDYDIVPLDPITRADGTVLDMRSPEVVDGKETGRQLRDAYLDDGPDLIKIIQDRLDDDFYDKFFDDRHPFPEGTVQAPKDKGGSSTSRSGSAPADSGSSEEAPTSAPASAADVNATKAKLAQMRARAKGDNPPPQQPEGDAAAPETPEAQEMAAAGSKGMRDFSS